MYFLYTLTYDPNTVKSWPHTIYLSREPAYLPKRFLLKIKLIELQSDPEVPTPAQVPLQQVQQVQRTTAPRLSNGHAHQITSQLTRKLKAKNYTARHLVRTS